MIRWYYRPIQLVYPANPWYVSLEEINLVLSLLESGKRYIAYFPLKSDLGFHTLHRSMLYRVRLTQ